MKYIKYNINQYFNSYLLGLKYILIQSKKYLWVIKQNTDRQFVLYYIYIYI